MLSHSFSSKEQVSFNFMAAVTICTDSGTQENKVSHCFHCFPIYLPWKDGTRCHDLSLLNVFFLSFLPDILYFLYKFIYFNWRLITSQYCIGFAMHQHKPATGVHVFPILNPSPTSLPVPSLWVIPLHQPQRSYIKSGLAIRFLYDIIYVSMTFAQIFLPSPSTTESKTLFYTSVSLCCLAYRVSLPSF